MCVILAINNLSIYLSSISYDRVLEEQLFALEAMGTPKPKESTAGLMKALRYISFGFKLKLKYI